MIAGLALFASGLVIGGLAPDMPTLVAGRAVQGLGAGVVPAVAYVAISRVYPDALRPRMFAVLSTAWVVPGLVGPVAAAFVATTVGWRWVFLGLLPLVFVAGFLAVLALRGVAGPARPRAPAALPCLPVLGVIAGGALALGSGRRSGPGGPAPWSRSRSRLPGTGSASRQRSPSAGRWGSVPSG